MKFKIFIVLLLSCLLVQPLDAQCRVRTRRSYTPSCDVSYNDTYVQNYVQDVAVIGLPVYLPVAVFQYLPAMQPTTAMPVSATPVENRQVGNSQLDIEKLVRDRVDTVLRERNAGDSGPPPLIIAGELPVKQQQQPDNLDQQVANMLASKSCVQCHTDDGKSKVKGGVTLFTGNNDQYFFQPSVDKNKLYNAVYGTNGRGFAMPPAAKGDPNHQDALKANDIALLKQWIAKR